jgi:serine/threonine protein kinase
MMAGLRVHDRAPSERGKQMQINCKNCKRVLEFAQEPPAFCSFCGASLSAAGLHEAATIAGPAATRTGDVKVGSPQTIAGYRLLKKLGQGGMGSVWEAEDEQTERRVAIKLLSPDLPRNDETTGRFLREARLAAAISHPRSTFIFGAGDDQGRPYIVMELMPGNVARRRGG